MSAALDDTARFQPDDDASLVAAAFTCPLCLDLASSARLVPDPYAPLVACGCERCDRPWLVHLNGLQYLRMRVAPPPQLDGLRVDASVEEEPRYWRW
jgi:hypothetical protein